MNGYMRVQERTKYSVWNLLGDVGGFYDGLFLIIGILLAPYTAAALKVDLINGRRIDVGYSSENRKIHYSSKYQNAMMEVMSFPNNSFISSNTLNFFSQMVQLSLVQVQSTFCGLLQDCCLQNSGRKRMKARVAEFMEERLDLRRIIQAQVDLKLLRDRLLSPIQNELFKYQRARQPEATKEVEPDSDDPETNILESLNIIELEHRLKEFQPQSKLDQTLLLGLIVRNTDVFATQPSESHHFQNNNESVNNIMLDNIAMGHQHIYPVTVGNSHDVVTIKHTPLSNNKIKKKSRRVRTVQDFSKSLPKQSQPSLGGDFRSYEDYQ